MIFLSRRSDTYDKSRVPDFFNNLALPETTRISPQLPSSVRQRTAVTCARRGEGVFPRRIEAQGEEAFSWDAVMEGGKVTGMDFGSGTKMKIIIFPVKFDKFTGFFDKFLKIYSLVISCKTKSHHANLSVPH